MGMSLGHLILRRGGVRRFLILCLCYIMVALDVKCFGAHNLMLTFSLRLESFCDSWIFLSSSCAVSSRALVNSASRADTQAAS